MIVDDHAKQIVIHQLYKPYFTNITCYINLNQHEPIYTTDTIFSSFIQLKDKLMRISRHPLKYLLV